MSIRLLVVVGPTAGGKTRLGVRLARCLGSEILSADSRQVYRGLDIGSGKDLDEYREAGPEVPYHLIDIADPRSIYTVFHYQRDCYRVLEAKSREERFARGVPLLMVGGTGLYIEAVLRDYRIANVPEDPRLRSRLMQEDHAELVRQLEELDLRLSRRTDLGSKKRVVRAIEVASYARDHLVRYSEPRPVEISRTIFGIEIPRDELHRRIDLRLEARLRLGLIEEVEGLLAAGVTPERMTLLGLEYREVTAYLTGAKSERQMVDDLRSGIRRLAKRQQTWFRGLPRRGLDVQWIGPDDHEAVLEHPWFTGARV